MLVNEIFDDDDDYRRGYYYPNYGYGGMPYYPPYPYRPVYGGGFRPGYGYNRPPGYNSGFQNNGNIIINTGGNRPGVNRPGNNYWDRFDSGRPGNGNSAGINRPRQPRSPISDARPNRPELASLKDRAPRPMPADLKRPSPTATAANWKGQGGYAGAKDRARPAASLSPQERIAKATPGYSKPPVPKPGAKPAARDAKLPKVQGSYGGARDRARPSPGTRPAPALPNVARPSSGTRDVSLPQGGKPGAGTREARPPNLGQADRGYGARPSRDRPSSGARPTPNAMPGNRMPARIDRGGNRGAALAGANRGGGGMDRAASQRGRQSLPQGVPRAGAAAQRAKR
jgi:hypothetical protein